MFPGRRTLYKMEEEEEAQRKYCSRMIALVRSKQQHLDFSGEERRHKHKGARGGKSSKCERQVVARDEFRDHRECTKRSRDQTSLTDTCQGPEEQSVPPQLISMLRLKTLKEELRRVSETPA